MFVRPRKHTARDGSISISFQILESIWDAGKKRSIHRVVENLGTCRIYSYDAARMTQGEYYRLILRKYKVFLDSVKARLSGIEERERLFEEVKKTIRENDNYQMRFFDDADCRKLYLIFNK